MGIESASLSLRLDAGPDADDEELQKLGQRLRNELLELDVDSVDFERHGSAPVGAKGDPITLGALAISLGPVALTAMINMVQSWLKRHQEATVSMKMGGDELTITGNPSKEQQQLIDLWVKRHKA